MELADASLKGEAIPRLCKPEQVRVEAMIRSNLVQDLGVQVLLVFVGLLWFSDPWIWGLWAVRWVVVAAIAVSLREVRNGRRSRALLLLACGHVVGVIGLVAIAPVLVPLAMLILVGDLFLGSYLHESIRSRYFITMVIVTAGVAALSFQTWTDLAGRTPRGIALTLIVGHTFASGFLVPRVHRQHYRTLSEARDRLTASEERVASAIEDERKRIAAVLADAPLADIDRLLMLVNRIREKTKYTSTEGASPEHASRGVAEPGQSPIELAASGAADAQTALRSLRRISHGVFPELLQSGLRPALEPLLGSIGTVERFDVPDRRWAAHIEAAVYMAVRELVGLDFVAAASSLVIVESNNRLEVFVRITGLRDAVVSPLAPMAVDRIAAVDGHSELRSEGNAVVFLASIPNVSEDAPKQAHERRTAPRGTANDRSELDANFSILAVFTMWGFRVALVGVVVSLAVLLISREPSGLFVVLAFSWLAGGALIGERFARRRQYGISIAALCLVTSSAAVILTALVTELSPVMALVVSLPTTLAVPFLSERHLDRIAFVQASALAGVAVLDYLSDPLITPVVSDAVPGIFVPLGSAAVAAIMAFTLIGTVRTVTNASNDVRVTLANIVHTADAHRQSIERDLHDGAQQLFVAISMQFRTLAKVLSKDPDRAQALLATIDGLLGQARMALINVAHGALVPELDEGRLADALQQGLATFGPNVTLETSGVDVVPPSLASAVYFCCHEALQNSVKHGGRNVAVAVSVRASEDQIRFSVSDNGRGFDTEHHRIGHGLQTLRGRITELSGELAVNSTIGVGTTVEGLLPQHH